MDHITIAEYARRAGVSKQTAYNRAKAPQYKGYFRKIQGILMVDESIFEVKQIFNVDSSLENGMEKGLSENSFKDNSSKFSNVEFELIETLKKQIEAQDKRLDDMFSMLTEKDKTINELTKNIARITESMQILQHERNLLEAGQVTIGQNETAPEPIQKEQSSSKRSLFSFLRKNK